MKKPEEYLTRGKGTFINCTDYDDAIQSMQEYSNQENERLLKIVEKQGKLIDYLIAIIEDGFDYKVDVPVVNKFQSDIMALKKGK
jgi:hypothetical protein